jgi:ComF family protein
MPKQFWNIMFPDKCLICGDSGAVLCPKCSKFAPYYENKPLNIGWPYRGIFEYDDRVKKIIAALKYQKNRELTPFIQKAFLAAAPPLKADMLVPVPLNPLRLKERGFNQAAEFVLPYARYHGIELRVDIVYRAENTAKLAALSPAQRQKETADIFQIWQNKRDELAGKQILIVDDIITTGGTVKKLAEKIAECAPASIEILGVFRPKLQN